MPPGLRALLSGRFDLSLDQASPEVIDETLRSGVVFRGTNLWILIFAIFVASVGLNVNSTAVIIGAMLISPLMGPIMGAGYGTGIGDFALVRSSLWNLAIATLLSLLTSTFYFVLTPLSGAHSELLARTQPTIWDVLIAIFGGLAGIIGATRKERGNIIPGVAIATALMPPLCTAGYGLSQGNYAWFAGAFYLFFINSVFIATATFLMVRLMRLPEAGHVDNAAKTRAHRLIGTLVFATALPSIWLAFNLIQAELFNRRAEAFLAEAFPAEAGTFVLSRDLDPESRRIHIKVVGNPVEDATMLALHRQLETEGLAGVDLRISQATETGPDMGALQADLRKDLQESLVGLLEERNRRVEELQAALRANQAPLERLLGVDQELAIQHPELGAIRIGTATRSQMPTSGQVGATQVGEEEADTPADPQGPADGPAESPLAEATKKTEETDQTGQAPSELVGPGELLLVAVEHPEVLAPEDTQRIEAWLRLRTGAGAVWIVGPPKPEDQRNRTGAEGIPANTARKR
jgi:uncharacterized hydrophobic protein (TIGR00271 family)